MIASESWLDRHWFRYSEMALLIECMLKCAPVLIDNADIVRDENHNRTDHLTQ